jgi:hypothetical protein
MDTTKRIETILLVFFAILSIVGATIWALNDNPNITKANTNNIVNISRVDGNGFIQVYIINYKNDKEYMVVNGDGTAIIELTKDK